MLKPEYSLFLGKADDKVFSGFVSENNLFLIVESEGTPSEVGIAFLNLVKERMKNNGISNLAEFESLITHSVQTANLPLGVSIAASYIHNSLAYLITLGEGSIYLQREKEFVEIIHGNTNASGPIVENDLFVLATSSFISLFSTVDQLKKVALKNDVFSVVDAVYEEISDKDDSGITALFFSPLESVQTDSIITNEEVTVEESKNASVLSAKKSTTMNVPFKLPRGNTKRILTFAIVAFIFTVLIWSVVLGYSRRSETELTHKVQTTKEKINSDLNEAQSIYSSNPSHASELIGDAKNQLQSLKEAAGTQKKVEIDQLQQIIVQREGQITKKEEKTAEEFYDLSVDTKDASAQHLIVNGDSALLPDKTKKTIYILNLTKKSLDKRSSSEVSQASLFAYFDDTIYLFIKDKGVYELDSGNKVKKVIDPDKDWGSVADMKLYNGNIYLLDTGKNEIYKYVAAESSFSTKQTYFKADVDIRSAKSLAIDSAVYIGTPDSVLKFNGGLPTDFKTMYPEGTVSIQKLFTDDVLQNVYVWNKEAGIVYILGKTGEYDRQIRSSIMKNATDFATVGNALYFLAGSKLYTIHL